MTRTKKQSEEIIENPISPVEKAKTLVTFSSDCVGRFNIQDHQALVADDELKPNEKFIQSNGKTYIQVTTLAHTYLL